MGGGVALQLVIRHPEVMRKLVVASATYNSEGIYPEILESIEHNTPKVFAGTPWREEYGSTAPNPEDFPTLVSFAQKLCAARPYAESRNFEPKASEVLLFLLQSKTEAE